MGALVVVFVAVVVMVVALVVLGRGGRGRGGDERKGWRDRLVVESVKVEIG